MATPYAAAAAALAVDASNGTVTPVGFEQSLDSSAEDLGVAGWDNEYGFGLVSPLRLVCSVSSCGGTTTVQPVTADPVGTQPAPTQPAPTEPAPTPAPGPSPTEPVPAEPAPTEPVVTQPAPTVRTPVLAFTSAGGTVVAGRHRRLHVEVTDSADGRPLAGVAVEILAERGGSVVERRWVRTDKQGKAVARFAIPATTRFTLRSEADELTNAAVGNIRIRWRAVPDVRLKHRGHRATVRVVDPQGQRIRFLVHRDGRWVKLATRSLDDTGRATIRGLRAGIYRAKVTASSGIAGTVTPRWKV
jgi:hypothetical protein